MSQSNEQSSEEPKLTPLQRVKQQQALLQKNRNAGSRKEAAGPEAPGGADSPNQKVAIQRRSGPSGS